MANRGRSIYPIIQRPVLRPGNTALFEGGGGQWRPTLASFKAFLAANASNDNAHSLAAMASPPTITTGTTLSGLGASNLTQSKLVFSNSEFFRFSGGGSFVVSTTRRRFPVATRISSGNVDATTSATSWRVGSVCDAIKVAIRVSGSATITYRFRVDGQYVDKTGTIVGTGGADTFALLTFASKASRLIEVEGEQSQAFVSMHVDPGDTISAPVASDFPMFILGDSFVASTGAGNGAACDGLVEVLADYLGIDNRWASGIGSTGFVTATGTTYNFVDRFAADLDRMIAVVTPKIIVMYASTNDIGGADVTSAITQCIALARSRCPAALIFVHGAWDIAAPGAVNANYTTMKGQVVAAAVGGGVYFVDPQGQAFTKSDGTHPTNADHLVLGQFDNTQVRAAIAAAV